MKRWLTRWKCGSGPNPTGRFAIFKLLKLGGFFLKNWHSEKGLLKQNKTKHPAWKWLSVWTQGQGSGSGNASGWVLLMMASSLFLKPFFISLVTDLNNQVSVFLLSLIFCLVQHNFSYFS